MIYIYKEQGCSERCEPEGERGRDEERLTE